MPEPPPTGVSPQNWRKHNQLVLSQLAARRLAAGKKKKILAKARKGRKR